MSAKAGAAAAMAGGRREPDAAVAHYLAEHARVRGALPGAGMGWLRDLREWGLARFEELGFPGPRDEHWKYTRTAAIAARAFRVADSAATPARDALEPLLIPGLDAHRLVFVNGRYRAELSDMGELPAGVEVSSLGQVLASSPERARPWVSSTPIRSGFDALNQAFLDDGLWLEVQAGVALERPVHLIALSVGGEGAVLANLRNLIVLGVNAQAKVIESYGAVGSAAGLTNAVTTVGLAEGASLEHYKLQEESEKAYHVARLDVRQARDSRFTSHSVSLGGEITRNDLAATLEAEGAECTLNGLYMVDGRQHVDFHTSIEHAQPRGTSREFYKGILGGRARGVFNGRIHVHPGAQKTDSQQSNQNLLLSRDAEVDTKPELEIYADDVKCSHGATVGQLDPDMLFYLRSRGIDPDAARGLLTYGFAQDVIERMSLDAVRGRLERLIVTRVPDADHVRAMV
jgi:Fe-S cluster assembly protein SufD